MPGPLARRPRRSAEEIRDRLLAAATQEFERSGYAGATTARIAGRAEVTEAQLFRYFRSKADLFQQAIFEPLDQHAKAFRAANVLSDGPGAIRETAERYIAELQSFLARHSRLLMAVMAAQAHAAESVGGITEIEGLRAYFADGAARMASRVGDDPRVDPQLMVRVSFAAVMGCVMFKDWLFPPGLASDAEIDAAVVDFVIDGIGANADPGLDPAPDDGQPKTNGRRE